MAQLDVFAEDVHSWAEVIFEALLVSHDADFQCTIFYFLSIFRTQTVVIIPLAAVSLLHRGSRPFVPVMHSTEK